jgi:acetyl esterase/lipase
MLSQLAPIPGRRLLIGLLLLLALVAGSFFVSPWPSALLIRAIFDRGAAQVSMGLQKHVPPGVLEHLGEVYDGSSSDGRLDLFLPPPAMRHGEGAPPPLLVWVHGGGAISGRRSDVGNYARILAGQGFAVAAVDYSIAPEARYPTPVRQVNAALAYLAANASRWGLAPDRFVLAGDSAGAHIAAQVGNLTIAPAYARLVGIEPALEPRQLRALLLFCGPYIMRSSDARGLGRAFMHTVLWAYSGKRDYESDAFFATANVIEHLTADFPPTLVSAGNGDPLLPHSQALASKLAALGAPVKPLFFASDHQPPLPHEYQFNLDTDAGQMALRELVAFVRRHAL